MPTAGNSLMIARVLAGAAWLAFGGAAAASDYSHDCRSSDGLWQMWDEGLSESADAAHKDIPYTMVKDTVLSLKQGYCLSKGQKFAFEDKTYVRRIRFDHKGQKQEVDLLCEMIADGLPAAFQCEKEVVTLDTKAKGVPVPREEGEPESGRDEMPSDGALWNHNGSIMRLVAAGKDRTFMYENPRPGMRKAGAKQGDVVFEGRREGQTYSGTAYIYSKSCGRQGYAVTGRVAEDDRSIVLEGEAPVLGDGCNVKATKRDELRFDYVRR